ncbi:MAG: glutamate-5-semialdehyde dehydrogenase [Pseudomonadota bacterium]
MKQELFAIAQSAKESSKSLAQLKAKTKNLILLGIAKALCEKSGSILEANKKDLDEARAQGLSEALMDRLRLDEARIKEMGKGLTAVADLPDPVGEISQVCTRPNGLLVGRMRIPLGVIAIIYESRPNVTSDAAGLCLKSGNACILRGGKEAHNSNLAIGNIFREILQKNSVPEDAVSIIPYTEHEAIGELLKLNEFIDIVIPRGGEGLIRYVAQHSRIPVIKHYKGVCHIYVSQSADLELAKKVCLNAKVQRPGVCNAMETLLVNRTIAEKFLPRISESMASCGVEIRGCDEARRFLPTIKAATEEDWHTEYLDLILSIRVVNGLSEAAAHIEKYGSSHTESIITRDYDEAREFIRLVQSSLVLVNASTRFNDGGQLGLGAEIGISTTRLHAFGPMGLRELTIEKYFALGTGQIRE